MQWPKNKIVLVSDKKGASMISIKNNSGEITLTVDHSCKSCKETFHDSSRLGKDEEVKEKMVWDSFYEALSRHNCISTPMEMG